MHWFNDLLHYEVAAQREVVPEPEAGYIKARLCMGLRHSDGTFKKFFFDSMFISVEDRTGRIRFSYDYSISFTCSQ